MDSIIFKAAAIGVVAAALILTLKKESPVFALLVGIGASVLILLTVLPRLSAVFGLLEQITENIASGGEYVAIVIKIIGIAYAAEFGASVCADAGEGGLAAKIELAGKVMIMGVSAPVVLTLLNQVLSLLP